MQSFLLNTVLMGIGNHLTLCRPVVISTWVKHRQQCLKYFKEYSLYFLILSSALL